MDWTIGWWENLNIDGWQVEIYSNTESGPILKRTVLLESDVYEFTYTYWMALEDDNIVREHLVLVRALILDDATQTLEVEDGSSDLELFNPVPQAPDEDSSGAGPSHELIDVNSDDTIFTWRLTWDNPEECDLACFAIWISQTDTMDPESETPYLHECISDPGASPSLPNEAIVQTEVESDNTHPDYYWWVAVFDAWGDEIASNIAGPFLFHPEWILEEAVWDDHGRWEDDDFWED